MVRRTALAVLAALLGGCLCAAQAQTSSRERLKAFAKLPDWSGLWEWDPYVGQLPGQQLSPEGQRRAKAYMAAAQPVFNAAWQPKYDKDKKARDVAIAADPDNPPGYPTCLAPPFPVTTLPGVFEWRVTPEETTLINSLGSVRHIYTDGRSHPPKDELWPTNMGDSVGYWEGDTLVVDTVATKPSIYWVIEGEPPLFAPMSNQLHFMERIRMVNHNEMQIQYTTEDPIALAKPIEVTLTYERVTNLNRMSPENECDPATDRSPVVNGRFTTVVH
jgi:hypothetical protein